VFYRIAEVSTDKASGHAFILVDFWASKADFGASKPPVLTNDFLMQLRPTGQRIVTNAEGWLKRKDGVFVDPETLDDSSEPEPEWERETVDRELPAEIRANIKAYWERAQVRGDRGSKIDPRIQRNETDPHGVLARADVKALRGAEVEKL
jgi:hypothetical protein